MCLAVPGRIVEIAREDGLRFGLVDFGGVSKRVCLEYAAHARPGDYVLVHVGFAIAEVDEAEAQRLLALLAELGGAAEEVLP